MRRRDRRDRLALTRRAPWRLLRDISWSVLPLVAGLFVLVEGLGRTGAIAALRAALEAAVAASAGATAWGAGIVVALACNVMNNLPVGLIVGSVATSDRVPSQVAAAMLIGVDLGPNLSVTGSLATLLWLVALRREGLDVGAWRFLLVGLVTMPPALILALACVLLMN
jgi:arsenical pump membrane protein